MADFASAQSKPIGGIYLPSDDDEPGEGESEFDEEDLEGIVQQDPSLIAVPSSHTTTTATATEAPVVPSRPSGGQVWDQDMIRLKGTGMNYDPSETTQEVSPIPTTAATSAAASASASSGHSSSRNSHHSRGASTANSNSNRSQPQPLPQPHRHKREPFSEEDLRKNPNLARNSSIDHAYEPVATPVMVSPVVRPHPQQDHLHQDQMPTPSSPRSSHTPTTQPTGTGTGPGTAHPYNSPHHTPSPINQYPRHYSPTQQQQQHHQQGLHQQHHQVRGVSYDQNYPSPAAAGVGVGVDVGSGGVGPHPLPVLPYGIQQQHSPEQPNNDNNQQQQPRQQEQNVEQKEGGGGLTELFSNRLVQILSLFMVVLVVVIVVVVVVLLDDDSGPDPTPVPTTTPSPAPIQPTAPSLQPTLMSSTAAPTTSRPTSSPTTSPDSIIPTLSPTLSPTQSPTQAPTVDLVVFPAYTQVALQDPSSPQSRAKAWLDVHPELNTAESWRLEQQFALVTFYYSMEGAQWDDVTEQRNFLDYSVNECEWGAQYSNLPRCNEDGAIEAIHLDYLTNDVPEFTNVAKVPPELAMIPNLAFIELEGNDFSRDITDYIPSELTELTALQRIKLDSNRIVGTLPTYLGGFTSMQQLDLPSNVSTILASFCCGKNLEFVWYT